MSNTKTENGVPPAVPSRNRETGAVSMSRPEDGRMGKLDDWEFSEDPFEGGVHGALNFNDAMDPKQRAKAAAEFHAKSNSII